MIRLRPYQSEDIRAVLERIRAGERRALLHLATGTGKTLIAVKLVERLMLAGDTVLVLAHSNPFYQGNVTFQVWCAEDMLGNPLVPGPVPNPWTFHVG